MKKTSIDQFCPTHVQEWRDWLEEHHLNKEAVWLILHKQSSPHNSIRWSEAVSEALCFGWVDSVRKSLNEDSFLQYFGKRKANSTWSKINKEKVAQLQKQDLMFPAGLQCIEVAKANGSWNILDQAEALIIPEDLEQAFKIHPSSKDFYLSLSKSVKKSLLMWIVLAKRPETRAKRIHEIAHLAAKGLKANPF